MIIDGKVKGLPLEQYTDTKANIEALTGIGEGAIAYATDTNEFGSYDGSAWTWGQGATFSIHSLTEKSSISDDDEIPGAYESESYANVKWTWLTIRIALQTIFNGVYSALSHNHASDYAPIAKGVTNGDTHDHSGGDGGTIAFANLSGTDDVVERNANENISIGKTYTIVDNGVQAVPLNTTSDLYMYLVQMRAGVTANNWCIGSVKAQAASVNASYAKGSNTDVTTGALTGTDGTDGKLTISVHTDGNLYVENRTGADRNFTVKIW